MSEFDFLTAGEIETLAFASAKKEAAEARADVIEPVQTELQKGDAAEFPVPIQPEQAKEAGIPDQSTVQEHRVPVFTPEEQKKKELRAEFEAAPVLDSFDKHGRIDLLNPYITKFSSYKGALICHAFVKNDYSFIPNPKLRKKIENLGRVSSDPERHRKSLALAAYIFNLGLNKGQTVGYVFDHIDEYIQPGGFFGNSGTVDGAYDHIRNVMTLQPLDNDVTDAFKDKFWTKFAVWTSAMAENVAAGVFEVPAFLIGGNMKYNPICLGLGYLYELGTPGTTQMQENMGMNFAARQAARSREFEDWITTPARFYHEEGAAAVQILQQELGYDPDFINKAWSGEMGWGDFFANAGMQFGIIAPKLYVDLTLGIFTGGASIFATSAAQAKYAYLRENPQASEYEADSYGALMGAIELGTEAITLEMGKGWLGKLSGTNKDLMCTSFGAALARTAKNWGEEALSEEAATFLGNVVDGLYGQWNPENSFTQNLFSDFGAGTIYSLPTSLIFSAPDYINIKHNQKLANLHAQTQQMIQTLENQETLSETENVLLKKLKMIEDSGDYEALGKVLDMAKTEQYLREQREAAADAAPANTTTITGEDGSQAVQQTQFAEDATAEAQQTAAAEVQRLQLKQMMPHNPEDTEQAVLQEAGAYGVPIQTTRAWTDEQVQILIERAGIPQDIAPGDRQKFIDRIKMKQEAIWNPDGTITINTAVVRPSRVPFVVAHELLVHEGLARVFNPSAKKELMDTIWKDFGETDLMKSIVRRYRLRRSRTDEVGQVYQEEMTDPERREAAEEFLAHLGETNGVPLETIYTQNQDEIDAWASSKKLQGSREHLTREWMYETGYRPERPGWLRQLISAIRVWLRQHGFTKLVSTLSDQDIQYILAKAAKADLSKRRARNGEAARLAIIGKEGARRMANAVQLLENLSTAKQMTADGKDAKAIKLATGWELGGDGKWRMEMPDAVFTTRAKLPDGTEYDRTLWDVVNTTDGKLSEYVVADEIFEAYPELKDYRFQIVRMGSGVRGSFNPDTKTISINQLSLTGALQFVDSAQARLNDDTLTAEERKSAQHSVDLWTEQIFSQINETLVHEVQHAIQHIEGFATGSNVQHFINNPEYDPKRLEAVTYYSEKFEAAKQNLEKYPDLKKMVDRYVELEDVLFSDDNVQVDEAAIDAEMDQIKAHFESIGKRELFMDYITGRDNYAMAKDAAEKHKLDPVESYRRTAGEVEARNVQERMDMTMEERLNSLLSETEDVAEKDKIYLNGLVRGGSEMAAALRKKGDPNTADQKNQLRSGDVPHIIGFMEWAGLKGKKLYADYEFLYSRHHKYFSSPEETKAAVELVLAKPEQVKDKGKNLSFVGFDEETGDIFRIEINPKIKGQANHIRSIFKITADNYNEIKLDPPRVLQPSSTELQKTGRKTMTITSFMNNLPSFFQNASEETGKTSEKINGEGRIGTDGYGDDNSRFSISPEVDVTETAPFKNWFGDSKVVDENGKPLVVYHGTNWDMLQEAPGDAVFSDKHRGTGSGDNGFFGRGFYFTFGNGKASEGEAGYYGKNVYRFYLSIQNPFYFSESLLRWNGKRAFGDEVNSVEIINAVKLFPELLKDYTLDTYDSNGDHAGTITLEEYADLFMRTYNDQKFSVRKTSDPNEIVVESDPVEHEEDGHRWTDYGFSRRMYKPGNNTDIQLLSTHLYLQNGVQIGGRKVHIDIPNRLLREFYGEPEFRSWLEAKGYDGVMQSKDGDEVVAFEPNQIKSATDNVGTFDPGNNDVRFSVAPDEELELVRGNSNSESGMRDAELEILQAFPKHKSFQAKEILKSIADKNLKNIETGIDAKINTTQYNKMTSNAAVNKSLRNGFSRDDHFEALANIEVLYQNAVLLEHTEDLKNNDSNVKIYRFASPFVIKNDICDVLLTVKETISSNQRRVYTLELTEIKKLSERGSTKPNSQYYTDSLYKLHQKHEKIKRFLNKTSEKINGGTDGYGDGVRFLLINLELTEDERSLVNIMKVLVSGQFDPDFDYAQRVKDVYGLEVSAEDAKFAAMVALQEKKADAQRAAREKAYAYFRSENPLFEFIDDFAGGFHDFHIVPVNGKGEKFTGTFISPDYVKWSEKRPQGKNESDKSYQRYLQKREEALKQAKGYDSADLAEAYARQTGLDTVTVEQEIVELFRDLKKPDILSAWKSYKDENLGMSRQEQEMLKKSQEDYFRNMAEDAAMEVLEAGQPVITEDWIKQNRDVFEVLYEQLTGKKEAPYKLSKTEMETLNAAIVQDHGAGSVYFAARKEAREASRQEFEKRLAEFRQAVQAREVNTMNLQRELVDFIRKNLPGDLHGKYEKRIISLMKLKTDYKREEVFQNILSDMLEDSLNSKRHDLIKRITDMLERNKTKRTDKNVPYSPMGDRQQVLDRIFKIVRMSEGTVALSRGVHAERLEAIEKTLEGYSDDQDRAEEQIKLQQEKKEIERDLFYLEHYGNLSHKEIEEIDNSMKMLEKFIRKGRDEFKSRLDERAQRTRILRESLRMEMSRGSLSVPHKDSLDIRENKLYRYALNNLSLSQQVRMFSRQEDDLKFHDSTHGKILAMIEDSTQKEATFIRKGQQRLDEVYTKLGIKNKIELGKFLSSLEQEQDTGIDIPVYVTVKKSVRDPEITYTSEAAGRQKLTGSFNVEHIRHLNELLEEGLQITSILRTGSLENYRSIAEEIRSNLGVPLEGGFTVCLEHDGSFRVLTGNESGGTTDHHFGRHQMTATMQQRMAEEDALFPIDQYARASIRARVEEYDAGMDTSYKPDTGDDIDNAALAAAEKSERGDRVKAPHVMLLAANPQNMVEGKKRLKISPAAAVQLLLEWEQDNYKLNFDFYGFTEEKIAALKSWLEINHSGALKLGYALRDLVFEQRGELDAAVFEKYGVHLPETKNFWYGDFSSNMADQIRDAGYGNPVGGLTVSANFLTGRKFHLQKPGTKTSFMNLFMMRQLETAHFIAYSQTIRDIRAIYNSSEVQNIMIREFGIDALLEWKKGLEQLASGGEISNFKTLQALANYIHEIFYPANVALNLKSVCSQIAGGTAYALYVPPAQLIKRLPFNRNNKKYRDFLETVMKSDYFLNRMNGSGFDPYMNTFLNPYSKKKVTPIKDSIIQKSMALTLWGDKVSSTTFGYAAYSYFYDQAIKNGKTVAEAKQYALQMWERATDETQQSGYMKDRNKFNTNPGILRALTAYMTSPMQQFGLELSSILRACKDPTKKNLTEAGRRILINHFVSTTIFNLIASAFRHGFNFGDYLEDWEDYVRGWILGQMDSLFLVGTVLTETFNLLTGNGLFHDEKSLLPMKENFVRDYRKIKSDITGRSEVDWLDYLQASGDVMMSAGPASSRLFGGALYISSREIRRVRRWFEGDEDKERKKKKAAR